MSHGLRCISLQSNCVGHSSNLTMAGKLATKGDDVKRSNQNFYMYIECIVLSGVLLTELGVSVLMCPKNSLYKSLTLH